MRVLQGVATIDANQRVRGGGRVNSVAMVVRPDVVRTVTNPGARPVRLGIKFTPKRAKNASVRVLIATVEAGLVTRSIFVAGIVERSSPVSNLAAGMWREAA